MNCKEKVAQALLTTEAVRLNVGTPFTFVSGIKSPIYCDNRKVIPSYLMGILLLSFFGQFHETAIHMSSTLVASPLSLSLVSVSLSVP